MGKFYVIEGLDGSGKTTQSEMIIEYLKARGEKVRHLSFPCYGTRGCTAVEMYLGGELASDPDEINGYASSIFFAQDRFISYITDWKRDIEDPDCTVIATRYTTANAYHQLSKLPREQWDDFREWLYDMEFVKLGLPKPDKVVLLYMDPALSSGNVKKRSEETGQALDIHELDSEYLQRCYRAASYAAAADGWTKVSCAPEGVLLPKEDIFEKIISALELN